MSERVGFYICHCGINIASRVRCGEVARAMAELPNVRVSRDYLFMCSDPGQELIERDVAEQALTRVVVAACSPRMHEATFRRATARAGLNPYRSFHQVCVREHVSWVHVDDEQATAKAKVLSRAGIERVVHQRALSPQRFPVTPATLVVGGGIAGMQAALDVASAGYQVYLVEKDATVGGHMLQLDKTFPTLDCAACIGTPKMVSVGQHPKIELLTLAEVESISGFVGNFKARVRKKARYVDMKKCTGCGDCASECPVERPNEWDAGTQLRRAIFRPFPQAVPIAYRIDKADRAPCVQACPAGTNVQGYVALVKAGRYQEATELILERLPLPRTLGRVCPAPCEIDCRRKEVDTPIAIRELKRLATDQVDWSSLPTPAVVAKDPADRVAVIGSGPAGLSAAYFLARMGYPVTVFEALPAAGGMLRTGIPTYRLPPEVLDQEIAYIERLGVEIRLSSPIGDTLRVDELFARGYRAVFAATGAHRDVRLGIEGEDADGVRPAIALLKEVNLRGTASVGDDVVVVGGGSVAMDAARTALRLGAKRVRVVCLEQRTDMPAGAEELEAALSEGVEIIDARGPARIETAAGRVVGIALRRCTRVFDDQGHFHPEYDAADCLALECNQIVVAIGQRPDTAWAAASTSVPLGAHGHLEVDPVTFATTRPGLFGGGELYTGPSIVVRAVANGREAAISIDRYLRGEDLRANRPERPRGNRWAEIPAFVRSEPRAEPTRRSWQGQNDFAEVELGFEEAAGRAEACRCVACGGCSECMLCVSHCKAGAVDHADHDEVVELDVGSVIVATGYDVMDPTAMKSYGYGRLPNVLTHLEFERMSNATGPTAGRILLRSPENRFEYTDPPGRVAVLHCIGSRDRRYHAYCSRTCCMVALKIAHLLEDRVPGVEIYNFYIDMRCFGKGYEEFLQRVQHEGVHLVRGKAVRITDGAQTDEEAGKLVVVAEDTLSQRLLRVPVDMAVLCTAMEPRRDAPQVARTFGMSIGHDGFFLEEHPKLEPVSTATSGIFVAGACQGPKDIPDSVAQAKAAASMAQALIARGTVEVSPIASTIDADVCVGCRVCATLCPYSAIEFDERRHLSVVNAAVCKGCGSCAGHCPSGAAKVGHFTDAQLFHEIEGLLDPRKL